MCCGWKMLMCQTWNVLQERVSFSQFFIWRKNKVAKLKIVKPNILGIFQTRVMAFPSKTTGCIETYSHCSKTMGKRMCPNPNEMLQKWNILITLDYFFKLSQCKELPGLSSELRMGNCFSVLNVRCLVKTDSHHVQHDLFQSNSTMLA